MVRAQRLGGSIGFSAQANSFFEHQSLTRARENATLGRAMRAST